MDKASTEKIIHLLEKIERSVNPPFWKKFLNWVFTHFFTILFLGFLGYCFWHIWQEIAHIGDLMNQTSKDLNTIPSSIFEQVERFKFWK